MECYREIRPAVDFCRALDHVLRIKTLWLKSYLLQILETLENNENRHKLVSFENTMLQHSYGNVCLPNRVFHFSLGKLHSSRLGISIFIMTASPFVSF